MGPVRARRRAGLAADISRGKQTIGYEPEVFSRKGLNGPIEW